MSSPLPLDIVSVYTAPKHITVDDDLRNSLLGPVLDTSIDECQAMSQEVNCQDIIEIDL